MDHLSFSPFVRERGRRGRVYIHSRHVDLGDKSGLSPYYAHHHVAPHWATDTQKARPERRLIMPTWPTALELCNRTNSRGSMFIKYIDSCPTLFLFVLLSGRLGHAATRHKERGRPSVSGTRDGTGRGTSIKKRVH